MNNSSSRWPRRLARNSSAAHGPPFCSLALLTCPRAAHVPADRPGWWQRHLGDSALHLGATSLDAASSWGRVELNPLLRSADGRFGARGLVIKLGIFGGVELVKWSLVRRGHCGRWVRSLSLAPAVAFGAAAARNRPARI